MAITRENLERKRVELQLTIALHQGAVQMLDALLAELDAEAPAGNGYLSEQQFAEMVAGPGARVEGIDES